MLDFIAEVPNLGLMILRLAVGLLFFAYGWQKVFNLGETAKNFAGMGIKPENFWAIIVGLLEVLGGLGIILGIAVDLFALLLAIEMLVAIAGVKIKKGFQGGWDFDFILLAACLALVFLGPGNLVLSF